MKEKKEMFPPVELQEVLGIILDQMNQLVACDISIIWYLTDGEFRVAASRGIPEDNQLRKIRMQMDDQPEIMKMFSDRQPVIWHDSSEERGVWNCLRHMLSFITAPLVYQNCPLGFLALGKQERNYYNNRDSKSVMAFANQVAMTLENARLYRLARSRATQLEVAAQVKQKITAILEPGRLLSEVVRLIKEKFGYYHVNLFLSEENKDEVFLRECIGEHAEKLKAEGLRLKIGEHGIVGNVARTGTPFLCNDVSQEPIYIRHELMPKTQSELAVPLQFGNVVVGVLDVQSKEPDIFQEDDITTLQILGGQIAVALENARLFKETRHQLRMMRVLHDISVDISSQLKLQEVLNVIVTQAARLLNAQGSTLAVCAPDTGLARIVAWHNVPIDYEELAVRPGLGVAGHVMAAGQPVIINNRIQWAASFPILDSPVGEFTLQKYDAILSVPLIWEGQAIGELTVVNSGMRRPFTDDDARFLSLLANLASAALNNAQLYERLEEMVEERTSELAEAREELLQKAEQLQQLLAATVYLQEEERGRIARDMHDGYNQLITGALFEVQAAKECLHSGCDEEAIKAMNTVRKLLLQIEAENRRIITGLRPPVLESHGLIAALYWLADSHQHYCGAACRVYVSGRTFRLDSHTETTIFRIVQESLNNVAVHALAENVDINVDFKPDHISIVIADDGQGFDTGSVAAKDRMGLIGMRERAQSIGGQLEVFSVTGKGTRVKLELPLPTPNFALLDKWSIHLDEF